MAELNKNNREALLNHLEKTQNEIFALEQKLEDANDTNHPEHDLVPFWDVDLFLKKNQEKLIQTTIISNQFYI